MELTDKHLEKIRETVREVDYGSVTINITANSTKLDLSIQKRVRYEDDPGISTMGVDVQKNGLVCYVGNNSKPIPKKKT